MSMSEVINIIEREAFERTTKPAEEISLVEFAEKVSPVPLNYWQREFFEMYEESRRKGIEPFVTPPRCRKSMTLEILDAWNKKL